MPFRGVARFVLLLGFCHFLISCGLKIGEQPAQNQKIDLGDKLGCLAKIDEMTSSFFAAKLKDKEIDQFVGCMIFSLSSFEKYTEGSEAGSYNPKELRNFLQRFFLKDRFISDELLIQLMKVKVLVVGGSFEKVTRKEFHQFVALLKKWKQDLVLLNRHISTYNLSSDRRASSSSVYSANQVLKASARSLSETLSLSQSTYHIDDFKRLLVEVQQFLNWNHLYPEARSIKAWADLASSFKSLTVGGSPSLVTPDEWREFLTAMANWYSVLVVYKHRIKHESILTGEPLKDFVAFAREIVDLGETAIKNQFSKNISFEQLDALFFALEDLQLMPLGLRAKSLSEVSRPLFSRVFGDIEQVPEKRSQDGIHRAHLARLEDQLDRWIDIQTVLSGIFNPEVKWEFTRGSMDAVDPLSLVAKNLVPLIKNPVTTYLEDLNKITNRLRPLFKAGQAQIFLVEEDRLSAHNLIHGFDNLSMMNFFRSMTGLAVRGYSHGTQRALSMEDGLSENETHDFYMDFRPLGIDLKLLDPRSTGAGKRSFLEANLFTYIADGLQASPKGIRNEHTIMRFEEAMEFISFLWSGGTLSSQIYNDLKSICNSGPNDVHARQTLDRDCSEQWLTNNFARYLVNAPGLNRYYQGMNSVERKTYVDLLFSTAFSEEASLRRWLEKSELNVVMMIIHYAEAIMTRYNKNGDDILDTEEVMSAFPIFSGLIKNMAKVLCIGDIGESRAKDIYRYMVEKGEVPEQTAETWAGFQWRRWFWTVELDRMHVAKVFSSIIGAMTKSSSISATKECKTEPERAPDFWILQDSKGYYIQYMKDESKGR